MNRIYERLEQGAKFLGMPPVTFLLALLIFFFGACGVGHPDTAEYFALVPGNSILAHYYVWNGITSPFFETNLVKMIANAAAVIVIGRAIEPVWKWRKFIHVLAVSIICSATVIVFGSLIFYRTTVDTSYLYHQSYGSTSLALVLLLGLKQEEPNTTAPYLASYGIRYGHLLQASLAIVPLMGILGIMPDAVSCYVSVYASWIYLRYFCRNPDGTTGDATDTFAFINFFPLQVRPFMAPVIKAASLCAGCCGCVHRNPRRSTTHSNGTTTCVNENAVAERRRARALKALDQKLQEIENLEDQPLDDWDGLLSDEENGEKEMQIV